MPRLECLVTYRSSGIQYGGRYWASSMLEAAVLCLEESTILHYPLPFPQTIEVTVLTISSSYKTTAKAAWKWRHKQVGKMPHPQGETACGDTCCDHGVSWHSATRCEFPRPGLPEARCYCQGPQFSGEPSPGHPNDW